MKRHYKAYTDADVILHVKTSKSMSSLLQKLGLRPRGGNYANMKRIIQKLDIDTSHWVLGKPIDLTKCFKRYRLTVTEKKQLIILRGHQCEECKNTEWLGQPIMLEVDHINGDRTNNSELNLKLLCPNCHAQTPTWRNRKLVPVR